MAVVQQLASILAWTAGLCLNSTLSQRTQLLFAEIVLGRMYMFMFSNQILQVLAGDVGPAIRTHKAFFSVWKRYGFIPEGFNLAISRVQVRDCSVDYEWASCQLRSSLLKGR